MLNTNPKSLYSACLAPNGLGTRPLPVPATVAHFSSSSNLLGSGSREEWLGGLHSAKRKNFQWDWVLLKDPQKFHFPGTWGLRFWCSVLGCNKNTGSSRPYCLLKFEGFVKGSSRSTEGYGCLGRAANEDIRSMAGADLGDFAEQIIQFN